MSSYTDQQYLKDEQYKDASNLNARILIHQLFSENKYGWAPWVFDVFEALPKKTNVLELGSGPAFIWTECPERIPVEWTITLSDLSPGMLTTAQEKLASIEHAFTYREIDAQNIPLEDETFDIVIANHMLYHVPDRPKALAEIRRVLKTGGILIAATNGDNHLAELNAWLEIATDGDEFTPMSNPFTLDNGISQLEPFFSSIKLLRYEDNLYVTDLDLMMTYIRSVITVKGFPDADLGKVEKLLAKELASKGEIFIQKDSGIFKAMK